MEQSRQKRIRGFHGVVRTTRITHLALFIVSGLLLNLMPSPDSLLVMTRSASQGWRAGSVAAFGIGTGTLVHILGAAVGLSAALTTSAAAFTFVKLAGAAYLLWMAVGLLRSTRLNRGMGALFVWLGITPAVAKQR
jgi:threonine/homoserine/homoserine lactone efflux protein